MQGCIFCDYANIENLKEEPPEEWRVYCEKVNFAFKVTDTEVYKGCPLTTAQREQTCT